jgi:hypothetical protein
MRARTLAAGATLAMLTAVWSAPAALAAEVNDQPTPPSATAPADEQAPQPQLRGNQPPTSTTTPTPEPKKKDEPEQGSQPSTSAKPEDKQDRRRDDQQPGRPEDQQQGRPEDQQPVVPGAKVLPRAELSVPGSVLPGDTFSVQARCKDGQVEHLSSDNGDVNINGERGRVSDDARPGRFTVELTCKGPGGEAKATASSSIKEGRGDGGRDGRAWLDLSPNSGERGDEVDVEAFCPGRGDARLEADGLDDVRLHRDGWKLTGKTHVERNADYGRTHATVICENGDRAHDGFYVRHDDDIAEFIDLDPGHGKRGDEIDVYVQCNDNDHVGRLEFDVLEDIDLDRDGRYYHGTAKVTGDAENGEHAVKVKCGGDWLEKEFFVHGDGESSDGGDQTSVYPKGAPETGGGPAQAPLGALALGLTGVVGAGAAGAGQVAERRAARR